jgi:hypothetical protein
MFYRLQVTLVLLAIACSQAFIMPRFPRTKIYSSELQAVSLDPRGPAGARDPLEIFVDSLVHSLAPKPQVRQEPISFIVCEPI